MKIFIVNLKYPLLGAASKQAICLGPTLGLCWPIVFDAGPTSTQYWENVSCLMCMAAVYSTMLIIDQLTRDVNPLLNLCCANVVDGGPTSKQHWVKASCFLVNIECIGIQPRIDSTYNDYHQLKTSCNIVVLVPCPE